MTEIPGWAYVGIGGLISAVSWFAKKKAPTTAASMILFFWVGIIFIAIGLIKIAFRVLTGKKKNESFSDLSAKPIDAGRYHPSANNRNVFQEYQANIRNADFSKGSHNIGQASQPATPQHASIVACESCGARHYDYANFCMKCGKRIKR